MKYIETYEHTIDCEKNKATKRIKKKKKPFKNNEKLHKNKNILLN